MTLQFIPHALPLKEVIFVGIDVHLRSYAVTAIKEVVIKKHWRMAACPEQLVSKLRNLFPVEAIRTVYEAGFSGFVLHRYLESQGICNIVVNPASVAVVKGNRVKTDKIDSKKLAEYLAKNLLKGIRIPSQEEEFAP